MRTQCVGSSRQTRFVVFRKCRIRSPSSPFSCNKMNLHTNEERGCEHEYLVRVYIVLPRCYRYHCYLSTSDNISSSFNY